MSQVSNNLLGLSLDEGAAFFVKESAQSESGSATITNVLLETFKFIGAQTRNEYLMPQMTQMNWAMRAFENHVPDCRLLYNEAMHTPSPMTAIEKFDELVRLAVGSSAAPCMRIIPGYAVLQSAYGAAQSMSDSLNGQYKYDGYVAQRGPIDIIPVDFTVQDLTDVATQIAWQWQPVFNALDLETISQLANLCKQWRLASLGTAGDALGPDDARRLLQSMNIYEAQPDWAQYLVSIEEETGRILVNGAVPTDQALQQAFPTGPAGAVPYRQGTRQLWDWARRHNQAMNVVPTYANVRRVQDAGDPAINAGGAVNVRDDVGRLEAVATEQLRQSLADGARLFYLDLNNVREFVWVLPQNVPATPGAVLHGGLTTNQMRSLARQIFANWHAGRPNAGGSGSRTARTIVGLRERALQTAALVPGVVQRLNELRARLLNVANPDVAEICQILVTAPQCQDAAQLEVLMQALAAPMARILPRLPRVENLSGYAPLDAMRARGYTVIGAGRYAPSNAQITALVPIRGRGVAPIQFVANGNALEAHRALDVSVVLEEAPSTVYSPVKTMLGTALLCRLLEYLNGLNLPAGYNFDPYDPANPYGTGQQRPCPRAILNRQIDRYEQAIVHAIDNATVEQMPDILRAVQKLVDARYFLNYMDEVIDSIMDREDWIYMLQSLIIGLLVEDGAQIVDSGGRQVVSVAAGSVPREAANFIFGEVLADLRNRPMYNQVITNALQLGLAAPPLVTNNANLARVIRAEVLFGRAVNGLELLKTLVDGSNTLVSNVHVGTIQHLIDVDLTNELISALSTVLNRDYLGLIDKVEFEAPWDCAEWSTQFAAFAFSVHTAPILYQAVDVAREAAVDSGLGSVSSALARVGFDWTEIAPANLRVRGADQSAYALGPAQPMAGVNGGTGFYNDAPIAHQTLKVTTVMPTYDVEAYNLVKAYLTMHTSRTYFAQVVGRDIADTYTVTLPATVNDPTLDLILNDTPGSYWRRMQLATTGFQFEKTPALANTAMILPYVANYLQKPAITRDVAVPQLIEIDGAKSLASTSGVTIMPESADPRVLTPKNGLAVNVVDRRSISTALPWVGS